MVEGLRPMRLEDCRAISLRREDSLECRATGARDDTEAVRQSFLLSTVALAWAPGGVPPIAFAGIIDSPTRPRREGQVWLLTADVVRQHPVAFHRLALDFLWACGWRVLRNHVDASYTAALRWLRTLGFSVAPAAPWGPWGLPFCAVEWRRPWTHSPF